jgi:uncharacterized membrane protein YbhN (UPF0104 family)
VQPRILAIQGLFAALYLLIGGTVLYLAVRGLGIGHVSFWQALAVYFFSLAFALITPIPLDIGLLEVSGVGAMVALGVDETAAVGVMLINRVLSIGASVAIALVAVVVLHGELRTAFQERPSHPSVRSPLTTPASDP